MAQTNKAQNPKRYVFAPLVDWWVILGVSMLVVFLIVGLLSVIWSPIGSLEKFFVSLVLMVVILYFIDMTFFTRYLLTQDGVLIHNQMKWTIIPYDRMYKIQHGRFIDLFSRSGLKRFALSSKNYVIYLKRSHWRRISVSPFHGELFLRMLMDNMEKERKRRISTR